METKKLYYICHNSLCGNKINIEDLFDLEKEDGDLPTIISCPYCHDEMILSITDEDE